MSTTLTLNQVGGPSPWGPIQTVRSLANDLEFVSTASHGGYWLGPARWAELKEAFPTFEPFAGAPWLEEDGDSALVVLLWPELHTPAIVRQVVEGCQMHPSDGWDHAAVAGGRWLNAGSPRALSVLAMAAKGGAR
jgi:hypothetical protein